MSSASRGTGLVTPEKCRDTSELTVVIFAGASGGEAAEGGRNKNFFPLRGKPIVQRQLDLIGKMDFRRRVLVTDLTRIAEIEVPEGTVLIQSHERQSENFIAVKALGFAEDELALVLFGDTPLMTAGMVHDFLRRCTYSPVDFHHGLVPYAFAESFNPFFPWPRKGRQPFHTREFRARLGCLSLIRPFAYKPEVQRRQTSTVMGGRKQDPDGLLAHLFARWRVLWGGFRFLGFSGLYWGVSAVAAHWVHERGFPQGARFLRRPMTLARLDSVAARALGLSSRFEVCPFGGASLDVDTEQDLEVLERYLEPMQQLCDLQERLASGLVDEELELILRGLSELERFDPEAAAEIRRHPEVYRRQQQILTDVAGGKARTEEVA